MRLRAVKNREACSLPFRICSVLEKYAWLSWTSSQLHSMWLGAKLWRWEQWTFRARGGQPGRAMRSVKSLWAKELGSQVLGWVKVEVELDLKWYIDLYLMLCVNIEHYTYFELLTCTSYKCWRSPFYSCPQSLSPPNPEAVLWLISYSPSWIECNTFTHI